MGFVKTMHDFEGQGESVLNGLRRQLHTSRAMDPEYSLAIRGFCFEKEQGALRAARIRRNAEGRFGSRISQRQLQGSLFESEAMETLQAFKDSILPSFLLLHTAPLYH